MIRRPPRSTLFPYPTLFPSLPPGTAHGGGQVEQLGIGGPQPGHAGHDHREERDQHGQDHLGPQDRVLPGGRVRRGRAAVDRKSTRLNSSHGYISYAVCCLKKQARVPADRTRLVRCDLITHHPSARWFRPCRVESTNPLIERKNKSGTSRAEEAWSSSANAM